MNHQTEIRHVEHAYFPRTYSGPRHWAPGWRMQCACGVRGEMRHTEEEAKIDAAFHGTSVQILPEQAPQGFTQVIVLTDEVPF